MAKRRRGLVRAHPLTSILGAIAGTVVGAVSGAFAGPEGAMAGAVAGWLVGLLAGAGYGQSDADMRAREVWLDEWLLAPVTGRATEIAGSAPFAMDLAQGAGFPEAPAFSPTSHPDFRASAEPGGHAHAADGDPWGLALEDGDDGTPAREPISPRPPRAAPPSPDHGYAFPLIRPRG